MNKKYVIRFLSFFICCSFISTAQTWQWAKGGGSPSPAFNNVEENVHCMAADKWGNIYVVGSAYQSGMNVDGNSLIGYGYDDIILTSFRCDGTYKWSKVIGTSMQDAASLTSIYADTLGGVYLSCRLFVVGQTAQFDSDTSISNSYKSFYFVKYDSAGVYQWMRTPQADSVTLSSYNSWALDINGDGGGNIELFCHLQPGSYANGGFIVNDTAMYVLGYNSQGNFLGGTLFDMTLPDDALTQLFVNKDFNNGRYYVCGTWSSFGDTVIFGSNPVSHSMYVSAFNNQGQFLWKKENSLANTDGFHGKPVIDDSGYIYIAGGTRLGDTFSSYIVQNTLSTIGYGTPIIVKLDSIGSLKWAKAASTTGGAFGEGVALRNDHEVVLVGNYPSKLLWQGANVVPNHIVNQGYDVFIASFNSHTGMVNVVDTLGGVSGGLDQPTNIVADGNGSVYIGGRHGGSLYVGSADTLQLMGGQSDFFIAKYGNQCNCALPVVTFTSNSSNNIATFTYTGSSQYDSLSWNFGDGGNSTQANPSHTYTTTGTYNVCLTVYNSCGSETHCVNVNSAVGINMVSGLADISVYPNPVTEILQVKGLLEATSYRLLSVTGAVMGQGNLQASRNSISTKHLTPGMYLLEVNNEHQQGVIRIVKQ